MSEETKNAEKNVPLAMFTSVLISGGMAFIMLIIFLYTAGSLNDLQNSQLQYPYIGIIYNATGSRAATAALTGFIIFMNFASTVSAISSGSRMVWSFARDRGVPLWRFVSKVS